MTDTHTRVPEFEEAMGGNPSSMRPEVLAELADDVRDGLGSLPKSLPSKWLYEGAGSELFELITELSEYYPTRTERAILAEHASEVVQLSRASQVVELGSGTSAKTRLLLDAFYEADQLRTVTAMDAAEQTLEVSIRELALRYPGTSVSGVAADFNDDLSGMPQGPGRLLVFLGGTIGNLKPADRSRLLAHLA